MEANHLLPRFMDISDNEDNTDYTPNFIDPSDNEDEDITNASPETKTEIPCFRCGNLLDLTYSPCQNCYLGDDRIYQCSKCYSLKRVKCHCVRCSLCLLYADLCQCSLY